MKNKEISIFNRDLEKELSEIILKDIHNEYSEEFYRLISLINLRDDLKLIESIDNSFQRIRFFEYIYKDSRYERLFEEKLEERIELEGIFYTFEEYLYILEEDFIKDRYFFRKLF